MNWMRDMPLRRKLIIAFALVTGGALLLSSIILIAADVVRLRHEASVQLLAEAALIGANSNAAITFADAPAASETLSTLRAIPDIEYAALYDSKGTLVASYERDPNALKDDDDFFDLDGPEVQFTGADLTVRYQIALNGRQIGSVALHSDLGSRYASLKLDLITTLGSAALAFAFALLLAAVLQRSVSVPILQLVGLVQRVSRETDYSLRAAVGGRDEIGRLAQGVNEMLDTVQNRDRELADHRDRLEGEVAERTADLERTNARLTEELTERARTEARLTQLHADLERQNRETEMVSEMNDRLELCRELAEIGPVIKLYGGRLFPSASGSVHLLDEDGALVEPWAHWGDHDDRPAYAPDDCWALRRGRPHLVPDPVHALACPHVDTPPPSAGYACVPLFAHGTVFGLLHLRFAQTPAPGTPGPVELCGSLAVNVAERIALAIAGLRLRDRLREQSVRDPLTGLYNRRYMEESLARELARAVRADEPIAVAMFDLDHFKAFNDAHGHDGGDALLRELGRLLREGVRVEDIACRFGGEEFTLILPRVGAEVARQRLEKLRERVSTIEIDHHGRSLDGVTMSVGIAAFPEHGTTAATLLKSADLALYAAKATGRNRVELFSDETVHEAGAAVT